MGQPVKLSDALVREARATAELAERSIAGQIEYWAQLGRAIEPLLSGTQARALRGAGTAVPLSQLLGEVDSTVGRARVAAHLQARPFPHYEPAADGSGQFVEIAADGTRRLGRFVGREFRAAE